MRQNFATLAVWITAISALLNGFSADAMNTSIYRSMCDRDFREVIGAVATPHAGPGASVVDLDAARESHPWLGFGVSFPESSCHLIMRLPENRRRALIESVFGKTGLGLSVGRVHMGSSDYSRHLYSYDDVPGDLKLDRFSIAPDLAEVIPVIKMAKEANPDLFLFASPWSPPGWMKDNGSLCGGSLLESMEEVYAAYIEKFLAAYAAEGLEISAFTIQNEPLTRQNSDSPTCFMSGEQEARMAKLVSRRLAAKGIPAKPWLCDHNWRADCIARVLTQLQDPELLSAVGGVAWHPYNSQPEDMAPIRALYPDLSMFMTEMGPHVDKRQRDIVWWADLAIRAINAGCRTFTSWCLALDEEGQPNVSRGFPCAGFVEIDSETGVTSPSSQFKAFRHFSPFVRRGAVVLDAPVATGPAAIAPFPKDDLRSAVFRNPDGSHVVVFSYKGDDPFARKMVQIKRGGLYLPVQVFCGAVTTVVLDSMPCKGVGEIAGNSKRGKCVKMKQPVFSTVKTLAGPRLAVDGVPQPAVAALPDPFAKPILPTNEVPALRDFANAGVRLFSNVWSMRCRPHDWWRGEGVYDWNAFDALSLGLLATCPEGWIMPRIKIEPPEWWCAAHPEKMSSSGKEVRADSAAWRELYRRMLRDVIAHVEASSYANNVAGYHVGGLACGEWLDWRRPESERPPVPARWADNPLAPPDATAARRAYMRDRAQSVADALLDAAGLVKELTHGTKVVCAFFGYAHGIDHEDMMRVVRSGKVDVFSSPAYYKKGARGVGDAGVPQAYYMASYALHGRVFYEEADPRTHLAEINGNAGMSAALRAARPADLSQSLGVLRRIVGRNLAQGTGLWWFLIAGNETFRDPALMETVRIGLEEERRRLGETRPCLTDVAVFTSCDEYATSSGCHTRSLYEWKYDLHTDRLPRTGVAYDSYELSDVAEPNLPDYKVYVFPNAFSPTADERAAMERLAAAGKKIVRPERPVSAAELRRMLVESGAHVWLDTDDVVFAGRGYLVVHASKAGLKRIRLPQKCDVKEVFGASPERKGVTEFVEEMAFGETRVYSMSAADGFRCAEFRQ